MLIIEQLNQYYGESHILRDISLEVPKGACTCIIGRNGVGKTTLLKTIMGQIPFKSKTMQYGSTDLQKLGADKRAYEGIAYVPQGRQIFPLLSVEDNLRIGLPVRKDKAKVVPEMIYELFPVLKDMHARRGGDLSGGQQQQLAIGRALVLNPSLLILDEPTEGIQPNIVQDITQVIRRLNQEWGLTVLVVEQKLHLIKLLADHFVLLDRGANVAQGRGAELSAELIQTYLSV